MMRIKSYEEQPIFCEESHIEIGIELNGEKKVNKIELSKKDGGKYPTVDEEIHSVIETKRGQEARTELAVLTVGLPQTHKEGNQVRIAEPVKYPSPFSLLNLIGSKRIEFGNIIKWIDANYFKVINGAAQSNEKDRTTYLGVINHLFRLISKVVSDNEDDNSVRLLKTDRDENGEIRAIVITPDAPSGINMTLLSDGFQNLFYWFANILTAFYGFRFFYENNEGYEDFKENIREIKDIPALIFIDEIDTYLHPTWQAKILNVLVEEFPKAQFFVTTHSPLVLWSLDKDKIDFNYYSISENGSEKMTYNPYSALVNDLLESVFKQPKRSQEISAMQNELFRSISFLNRDNYDAEIASVEQKLKTFQSKLYPGDLDALTAEMTLRSKKFNIQKLKNANNQ
jgi:hypothetical protein